ncbi:hypothetical protein EVC12_241 [Rhizobium phage RHph_I42]|nr:hypothetical protein EVC12_241 [Rhizobium phage RHph_I42]
MTEEAITNEDWYVEYISVIYRTLDEMFRVPLRHDLATFAKEWLKLTPKQRGFVTNHAWADLPPGQQAGKMVGSIARDDVAIYHVIQQTMHPSESTVFEYNADDDFSIFGSTEEVDSYFSYDTVYTYFDMLAVVMDASRKLLALTGVAVDPRLYTAANALTGIFGDLVAFGRGTQLSQGAFTDLAEAFVSFETYIVESNEEAEEDDE